MNITYPVLSIVAKHGLYHWNAPSSSHMIRQMFMPGVEKMFVKLRQLCLILVAGMAAPLVLPHQAMAFSDLAVKMEATPGSVALGQSVTFTATVTNLGPDPARHITVSDNLPGGVKIQAVSSTSGECAAIAGVPFCNLKGMAVGDSATVTITILVEEAQNGDALFNTVFVTASKNKDEPKENNQAETITAIKNNKKETGSQ